MLTRSVISCVTEARPSVPNVGRLEEKKLLQQQQQRQQQASDATASRLQEKMRQNSVDRDSASPLEQEMKKRQSKKLYHVHCLLYRLSTILIFLFKNHRSLISLCISFFLPVE